MGKQAILRLGLQFDDNTLVPLLFGEHGSHLARIEEQIPVDIASKGNELVVSGTKDNLNTVQEALNALWERLANDLPVGLDEVDAALRIASKNLDHDTRDMARAAFLNPKTAIKSTVKDKNTNKSTRITPRTPNQATYLDSIKKHELVFGIGPAGTGKTFLAVAQAVTMLLNGDVDRLILCRPAVEAGENLGFLPGDMQEKVDPYLRPIYDALHAMLPPEQVVQRLSKGDIEVAPLAFMRGRTLSNAFIILDEAQNTTIAQMKMALTRLGEGSHMVINGDPTQIDLPKASQSGLLDAMKVLDKVKDISFVHFDKSDVVRHHLVAKIVEAYDNRDKTSTSENKDKT